MGDYLKEAYLLAELNKNIDNDYQKLSDKLHNLELSHNRKKKALIEIRDIALSCAKVILCECPHDIMVFSGLSSIGKLCDEALWSDGCVYYKPKKKITMRDVKRKKMKGGRQCAQD